MLRQVSYIIGVGRAWGGFACVLVHILFGVDRPLCTALYAASLSTLRHLHCEKEFTCVNIDEEGPGEPSYVRLRDLIRVDIIEGRLPSGSRLKIAELAARYASSGIPVREALQQLQGEGVVIFTPNRGARVRQLDDTFLRNIYEIRAVLEPFLMRWFARHRSDAQLAELEATQQTYDLGLELKDPYQCMACNRRFHSICYDTHYNDEARIVATRHSGLIQAIAARFPPGLARNRQAGREHWLIVERIREQDEDGAAAAVAEHVRQAGLDMIERLLAAGISERRLPPQRLDHGNIGPRRKKETAI
jgi:DNA-binding GntR family transcriptional regulator